MSDDLPVVDIRILGAAGASPAADESFMPIFDIRFAKHLQLRRAGFREIFTLLEAGGTARELLIVETGSMRVFDNWEDGQSTRLFDAFVTFHGGEVLTVDLSAECGPLIRQCCGDQVKFTCDDSVRYLNRLRPQLHRPIDLLYLDSFDLDVLAPSASAFHHMKELAAIWPALGAGSLIAVDDNPPGNLGKGYLVEDFLAHIGVARKFDGYQKVWQL